MTVPLFEPTWSVSQLCGEIRGVLEEVFASVWVVGEVQRVRRSRPGHIYFELVEKDAGDSVCGKLDAVLWRSDAQRVSRLLAASGQELTEGMEIRCRGSVDFWAPGGRLQFVVREVDPVFTLGLLEKRRRETLAALDAAGLLEVNRGLTLSEVPLEVALVTSEGSAAYHDFLATLRESGYGFRVTLVHASVQGARAERELVSALRLAAAPTGAEGRRPACVVLIRGGGAKSDLAVFDSRAVAEAVARSPLPVLTGLGHQIDESITDKVAHTALKTPTKVAELLVERVARGERAVDAASRALRAAAVARLREGREALGRAERGVELGRTRLAASDARLQELARALVRASGSRLREAERQRGELARRLASAPPRLLNRQRGEPGRLARRLAAVAGGRLAARSARLDGLARLARELAPERTLARGYTITRLESSGSETGERRGALLTDPSQVAAGTPLVTQTAGGTVASRVEESPS